MKYKKIKFFLFIVILFFEFSFGYQNELNWNEIESNPFLLYDNQILEMALQQNKEKTFSIINNNFDKLKKNENFKNNILEILEKEAVNDISFLNNNPILKKEFFLKYGIIDEGCNIISIERINGDKEICIGNKENYKSICFKLVKQDGWRLTKDNKLILRNNLEIYNGEIEVKENITIWFGEVNITNVNEIQLTLKGRECEVYDNKLTILCNSDTNLTKKGENITIESKNALIKDGNYDFGKINGKMILKKDYTILEKGTFYHYDPINIIYTVRNTTFIFNETNKCNNIKESCIEINQTSIKINGKNNKIELEIFSSTPISSVFIEPLIDSEINITENGKILLNFKEKKFYLSGDIYFLSKDVYYKFFLNEKICEIQIKNKEINYCCNGICEKRGSLKTIDYKKLKKSYVVETFEKAYNWAINAANNENFAAVGGGRGEIIYPDVYQRLIKEKTNIEKYKAIIIDNLNQQLKNLEQELKNEKDLKNREEILKMIESIKYEIEVIKRIKYAYDCIGLVQAAFFHASGDKSFIKKTDGYELGKYLKQKYNNIKIILVIYGKPHNSTHYLHNTGKYALLPKVRDDVEILYFENKYERDSFIRKLPPGSPFQNYNIEGTPQHSGIKGISYSSIEAHISPVFGDISVSNIERYRDPILFAIPTPIEISFDDIYLASR